MRYFALLVCSLLLVAGCSGGKVGLGGSVTYDDGSPVPHGTVCFETDTFLARGTIGKDGKYIVESTGSGDGLPPGTYRVYLTDTRQQGSTNGDKSGPSAMFVDLVEAKYTSASSSGLTVTADGKQRTFDIKVGTPPKK
ncbi:MAG: hypothetical protein ACRC46_01880 [Thermoguttaceae bacterium]